jgi:replication initiation protein RepC
VRPSIRHRDWRALKQREPAYRAEFLALSPTRVKMLNRLLFEAGIFVLRDSPTGKRYGRRDDWGRIIEAYGFDLSPLAYRYDEFVRLAAEARAERDRMRMLRKRATCARRAIAQIGETLAGLGPLPPDWPQLAAETAALVASLRRVASPDDLVLAVNSLESRKAQADGWAKTASSSVEISPVGLADEPHTISTNPLINPKDTVIAAEEGSRGEARPLVPPTEEPFRVFAEAPVTFRSFERLEKVQPAELLQLAPRLAEHTRQAFPDWADVVDAAGDGLRHELGVSQALWGEACLAVGRVIAAVALAIVSTKPPEHFTRGAGGYFAAMIKRAKTGELHLDRSLWKLRRDRLDRIGREATVQWGAAPRNGDD